MYSFKTDEYKYKSKKAKSIKTDGKHVSKKAKGIKTSVVKNEITFNDYRRSLFSTKMEHIQQTTKFNTIRSKHEVYTIEQSIIGLCSFDDKRYLIEY